jgi:hypothetical protein
MTDEAIQTMLKDYRGPQFASREGIAATAIRDITTIAHALDQSRAETAEQRKTCDQLAQLSERLRKELAAKMDEVERLKAGISLYKEQPGFNGKIAEAVLVGADARKPGEIKAVLSGTWKPKETHGT